MSPVYYKTLLAKFGTASPTKVNPLRFFVAKRSNIHTEWNQNSEEPLSGSVQVYHHAGVDVQALP